MIGGETFVGEIFEFESTQMDEIGIGPSQVLPTGHLRTQNGSDPQSKFWLSVRIRTGDSAACSPHEPRSENMVLTRTVRVIGPTLGAM